MTTELWLLPCSVSELSVTAWTISRIYHFSFLFLFSFSLLSLSLISSHHRHPLDRFNSSTCQDPQVEIARSIRRLGHKGTRNSVRVARQPSLILKPNFLSSSSCLPNRYTSSEGPPLTAFRPVYSIMQCEWEERAKHPWSADTGIFSSEFSNVIG